MGRAKVQEVLKALDAKKGEETAAIIQGFADALTSTEAQEAFNECISELSRLQKEIKLCENGMELLKHGEQPQAVKDKLESWGIEDAQGMTNPSPSPQKGLTWLQNKIANLITSMVRLAGVVRVVLSKHPLFLSVQAIDVTISWPPALTISFKP